jgi:putative membrane protein
MNLKLLAILVLTGVAAIFIVQNADVVELRFFFWKVAMSRALMFVFLVLIGVAIGWFLRGHLLHKTEHKDTKQT